ncbi:hypothetical protein MNBD_GAMMA16-2330 [hydrothermal vent metagenome]|uniref:Lipoprotein n=1 Tax=hydrothermal vent metagenome TaxID=652676 RepID=A0A3B0Z7V3_9ZZZZ
MNNAIWKIEQYKVCILEMKFMANELRSEYKARVHLVRLIIITAFTLLLAGCDSPSPDTKRGFEISESERQWDIPIDPQEKAAYDYAHALKLPDSVLKPMPFDFAAAERYALSPGYPTVSDQYFDHLCSTEAGEYIFKTVDKVEGLYQMRLRQKATTEEFKDLYRMEDPYGYVEGESENVAFKFARKYRYRFLEQAVPGTKFNMFWITSYDNSMFLEPSEDSVVVIFEGYTGPLNTLRKRYEKRYISKYAYTWRGIKREHDRTLGIAGGELIVIDLQTSKILGVRRGFARTSTRPDRVNWEFTPVCPRYETRGRSKDFDFSYWFIRKVLRPVNPVEWPNVNLYIPQYYQHLINEEKK